MKDGEEEREVREDVVGVGLGGVGEVGERRMGM